MEDSTKVTSAKGFVLLSDYMQIYLDRILGKGGLSVSYNSIECLAEYDFGSLSELQESLKKEIGMDVEIEREGRKIFVNIKKCPLAETVHLNFFKKGSTNVICPVVLLLASIVKRETNEEIEISIMYSKSGLEAEIIPFSKEWKDLLGTYKIYIYLKKE